jgi:hypothetical protein
MALRLRPEVSSMTANPIARPRISVVVVVYDMAREAPRTLQALAPGYQREISADEYEVVVVDNGSPVPLGEAAVSAFGPTFRYHYIQDASPSPAPAVNAGAALCRGQIIGVLIDGARIATPGLLHFADLAFRMHERPTVAALGWHLGPEPQQRSVAGGYDRQAEDRLLADIGWPDDGYRLFEIASLAGSSSEGCFCPIAESNSIFLARESFLELGGYDEAFDLPGGGLANLDFYNRACARADAPLVILLGEGTFHQLHGGVSTNISGQVPDEPFKTWAAQYEAIRGEPWALPSKQPEYLGAVPTSALPYIAWSAQHRLSMLSASREAQARDPAGQASR